MTLVFEEEGLIYILHTNLTRQVCFVKDQVLNIPAGVFHVFVLATVTNKVVKALPPQYGCIAVRRVVMIYIYTSTVCESLSIQEATENQFVLFVLSDSSPPGSQSFSSPC